MSSTEPRPMALGRGRSGLKAGIDAGDNLRG